MERMCRLCLQDGPYLGTIEDGSVSGTDEDLSATDSLAQLILRYMSIRVIKHESTANVMICCSCRVSVEEWHTFRESCVRNDKIYQRTISRSATDSTKLDKNARLDERKTITLKSEPNNTDAELVEGDDTDFEQVQCKDEQLSNSCYEDDYEIDKAHDKQLDNNEESYPDFEEIEFDDERLSDTSSGEEYLAENTVLVSKNNEKTISTSLEIMPLKKRGGSRIQTTLTQDNETPDSGKHHSDSILQKHSQKINEKMVLNKITISPVKPSKKRGRPKEAIRTAKRAEVCTICGKCIKNMTEHMRIHNNEKRHQCPYCSKAFVSTSNYNSHVNIHTRAKMYKCDLCDKQYVMLNSLKQHRITHFKERIYICPVCGKAYYQPTGLARHKRTHYEEPKIKCSACDKMFMTNADLRKHFTKHLDEKPFSCEICSRAFSRKDNLRTHMKTHRGNTKISKKASTNSKASKSTGNDCPETSAITE